MDILSIEAVVAEANQGIAALAPQLGGLHGYEDDELTSLTHTAVVERESTLLRRRSRLENVKRDALALIISQKALFDDGYPDIPNMLVEPDITADLDAEIARLTAARAGFTSILPTTTVAVHIEPETPTPQ